MWCINLTYLYEAILWLLTIFNFFVAIALLLCAKGWNRTADKIYYQRRWGIMDNSHYQNDNEIDDIRKQLADLTNTIEGLSKKRDEV